MTIDVVRPPNMTLSIGRESRPEPAGGISSLRNSWVHSLPFPFDTVSLPTIGISVQEDIVSVTIESAADVSNAKWLHETIISLIQLTQLPKDWNSESPNRIEPKVIEKMLVLLVATLDIDSTSPTVVPTTQGGVQVEWHQNGIDLEIEALNSGKLEYFFSGPEGDTEGAIDGDFTVIKPFIQRLKGATAL